MIAEMGYNIPPEDVVVLNPIEYRSSYHRHRARARHQI